MQVSNIHSGVNQVSCQNKKFNKPCLKNNSDTISFKGVQQEQKLLKRIFETIKNTFTVEKVKKGFLNVLDALGNLFDLLLIFH